jgi:hypothetical protein
MTRKPKLGLIAFFAALATGLGLASRIFNIRRKRNFPVYY